MPEISLDCFLLTRQWRDTPSGLELSFWGCSESGPVRVVMDGERAVAFIPQGAVLPPRVAEDTNIARRPLALRDLEGQPVDGLYFRYQRALVEAREHLRRHGVQVFESDLKPSDRFLMERFISAAFHVGGEARDRSAHLEFRNPAMTRASYRPRFEYAALDIETSGFDGQLYSIAVSAGDRHCVFMVSDRNLDAPELALVCCRDEREALGRFFQWMSRFDPDLILGWNVLNFDLDFLERRCEALGVGFALARGGEGARILQPQSRAGVRVARVPGRVVLDGIEVLRASFRTFESFELEQVSQAMLGRGKRLSAGVDKLAEITRLYREDPVGLARYNLEDCRLVEEIFERAHLVDFAMRRAEITGLAMDRLGGSVAAFDHLYLPRLHRRGRVARDVGAAPGDSEGSPGGYVLDSKPGLYDDVLLLDFKSLYPSIIRTFKIDPFGLAEPGLDPVPGFAGAAFAREGAILPDLVKELAAVREEAKAAGDGALSQALKILMNSFYGVLGTSGCRFFDPRLATSITRRGHEIILKSRDFIEARGHPVIYGDTDSLFLLLPARGGEGRDAAGVGEELARALNDWWRSEIEREHRLESFLEAEFETHFLRFLMPTVRGERTGSKKRYAGLVRDDGGGYELVFKGLESVRTDWTPLARAFQRELYRRVFQEEPFEEYVRETLDELRTGRLDDQLVYRKRLRRPVAEYTHNVPPHVQAAAKLARPGRWVSYVITRSGPEPVSGAAERPRPDYEHYRERQLAPAADGILQFLGTSFAQITDTQLRMF